MRQAVIVIHGIGEQRPMTTLREFVKGVVKPKPQNNDLCFYSKPDRLSDSLELRRLTVKKEYTSEKSTDFYEFYWQHLMTGTTFAHIQAWLGLLLFRQRQKVPPKLRSWWFLAWVLIFLALLTVVLLFGYFLYLGKPPVVEGILAVVLIFLVRPLLLPLLRYLGVKFGLNYIGDAARYLSPFPENVGIRHAIRSAGLDMLRKLHLDPLRRYDRIIIVGHSLGSVIAYDVLTYFWQEMHSKVERSSQVNGRPELEEIPERKGDFESSNQQARQNLFEFVKSNLYGLKEPSKYMEYQHELLQEYSRIYKDSGDKELVSRFPWRITDLVTLGSPLTYADFLLADDFYPFSEKVKQREFPTCPPQPEDQRDGEEKAGLLKRVLGADAHKRSIRILHHSALFACTRWTNLYFPGDIIAGPLAGKFGWGIHDVPLSGPSANNWTSHVKYWAEEDALEDLIKALRLGDLED
jgi:hypothetical protein